jgi:hypothetical protein
MAGQVEDEAVKTTVEAPASGQIDAPTRTDARSDNTHALVVFTTRALFICFAVFGALFLITPDGVITRVGQVGALFGQFATAPRSDEKLCLGLGVAYMAVIAAIALLVSFDVPRYRPLLLVLAAGKTVSSLCGLGFFVSDGVFVYLANFVVDGLLVALALGCWVLAHRVEARTPG